jgi:hypothetical protein
MTQPVSIEDTLAIQDLLGRYCWYVDEGMADEWAGLYTEDGIFEGTRPQPVCGRAALAEVPRQVKAHGQGKIRHQYGNLYIEPGADENTLVARFYNQLSSWDGGGKLTMLAISTATLVRAAKGQPWRIKRNTIVPLS